MDELIPDQQWPLTHYFFFVEAVGSMPNGRPKWQTSGVIKAKGPEEAWKATNLRIQSGRYAGKSIKNEDYIVRVMSRL